MKKEEDEKEMRRKKKGWATRTADAGSKAELRRHDDGGDSVGAVSRLWGGMVVEAGVFVCLCLSVRR